MRELWVITLMSCLVLCAQAMAAESSASTEPFDDGAIYNLKYPDWFIENRLSDPELSARLHRDFDGTSPEFFFDAEMLLEIYPTLDAVEHRQ